MVAVSFLICSYNYLVNMYNRKTIDKNGKGEIIMLTMPISFEELQELFHTKEACLKFEEMLEQLYGKDILCFIRMEVIHFEIHSPSILWEMHMIIQ